MRVLKLALKAVGARIVDVHPAYVEHYQYREGKETFLKRSMVLKRPRPEGFREFTGHGFQLILGGRLSEVDKSEFEVKLEKTIRRYHPGTYAFVHSETMLPPEGEVQKKVAELRLHGKDAEADGLFEDHAQSLPTIILYSMDPLPVHLLGRVREAIAGD